MFGTQKNQLRGLSKEEFTALKELCRLSKNLFNVALYNVRQHYFTEKRFLKYESNYHVCKSNENYLMLNTDIAQQTMKVVDRSFKSFFKLISKAKSGGYQFSKIALPKYLKKDEYFSLFMPRVKVKDGYFTIPMSPSFKKQYGVVRIPFPKNLEGKTIKEVRIHPKFSGRYFEAEYIYLQEKVESNLDKGKFLSIDLGLENLATCVTDNGQSFIVDGRRLKSINQWYNKENSRLQSIKDKQKIKGITNKQASIIRKRNMSINDYLNKSARHIVNYCLNNNIGNIVVGCNIEMKQNINIGRKNNQQFTQLPIGNLRMKLQYLCERYSINYIEQEESYTSKADFFANDDLPTFSSDNPSGCTFSGKRISRGQYLSINKKSYNADCIGALNILRKSNLVCLKTLQASGCLAQPLRIRVS